MQASEDAKKLVNQEKSFACAEIESARAVVQRIGEALEEQDITFEASKKQVPVNSLAIVFYVLLERIVNSYMMVKLYKDSWLQKNYE